MYAILIISLKQLSDHIHEVVNDICILLIMNSKRLLTIIFTTAVLLLIPLIAMRFTNEVNWTLSDFMVAGTLLLGTGLILDLILRKITSIKYRVVISSALLLVFLLIWAELAVGIFGTPFSGS